MNYEKYNDEQIQQIVRDYNGGKTVIQIASIFGMSQGKAYGLLKSGGCSFRKKGTPIGFKQSEEFCKNLSIRMKAKKLSEEQRKNISESKKSHYNGLNGYGHTKKRGDGYVSCYVPDHPNAHIDGYVMLHTVLMEIRIGRYLNSDEVVHHINGVRDDNRIGNLKLMKIHDHQSMHMKKRHEERRRLLSTKQ